MQIIKYIIIFLPIIVSLVLVIAGLMMVGYKETKDIISIIPLSLVVTIFYNIFLFLVFFDTNTEVISQTAIEYNLVSTKFSNTTEGSFFLGTGVLDNEEYVYYVIRDGDELKREKTQNYKIYITDKEPHVEIERKTIKESSTHWLYNINDVEEKIVDEEDQCVFYIPENSIVQNININ